MAKFQHMYLQGKLELWSQNFCFDQLRTASSSFILLSFPIVGRLPLKKKKLETSMLCEKNLLELSISG